MNESINRIEKLDASLFVAVPSQTSAEDRRSLLAVQRAIARTHNEYVYLEIGSHLGGTIQPHLADDRCQKIYSIDPRPLQLPDDRCPGHVEYYEDNSSKRMLDLLGGAGLGDVRKIDCIEMDASQVAPSKIEINPLIALIDGEHTKTAVMSDFCFCKQIVSKDGVILFHDFNIISSAILELCVQLRKSKTPCFPVRLEGSLFAIFFDRQVLVSDSYLFPLYRNTGSYLRLFRLKSWLKQTLPDSILPLAKWLWDAFRKRAA